MNREELSAMTDAEILAFQRKKRGNPHMPLSMAKKLHREEFKWLHLAKAARPPSEACRYLYRTCTTHSDRRPRSVPGGPAGET